jgi:hypothetical protein
MRSMLASFGSVSVKIGGGSSNARARDKIAKRFRQSLRRTRKVSAVRIELLGAGFDQHFFALLGEPLTFREISCAREHERSAGFDRAQVPLAQLALRHQQ